MTCIRSHGPGAGSPYRGQQQPPGAVRLVGGDLLLQDRGDQRLHDQARTRQPEAGVAAARLMDEAVPGGQRRRVVGLAEQVGQPVQQPVGTRPPRLRLDAAGGGRAADTQRAGALGGAAGAPHAVVAHGRWGPRGPAAARPACAAGPGAGRDPGTGGHAARLGDAGDNGAGPFGPGVGRGVGRARREGRTHRRRGCAGPLRAATRGARGGIPVRGRRMGARYGGGSGCDARARRGGSSARGGSPVGGSPCRPRRGGTPRAARRRRATLPVRATAAPGRRPTRPDQCRAEPGLGPARSEPAGPGAARLLVGGEAHRPGRDVGAAPDADAVAQFVVGADPRAVADDRAVQDRTGADLRPRADQGVRDRPRPAR